MSFLSFIVWSPSPEMFTIGSWEMRWYGFLFALGFLISQQLLFCIFRKENKPERDVESLTFFMVVATIFGARFGHVFFYEPDKYLAKPGEILKVWEGGLASHGAAIGILTAIYLYSSYLICIDFGKIEIKKRKRPGQNYMWVVDRLVIVVALTGALIRLGNFINSEIVGVKTESDYGVVFAHSSEKIIETHGLPKGVEKVEADKLNPSKASEELSHPVQLAVTFSRGVEEASIRSLIEEDFQTLFLTNKKIQMDLIMPGDKLIYRLEQEKGTYTAYILVEGIPRHPAQLYESLSSFLIFIFLYFLWERKKEKTPPGFIFGIFLIVLFGLRFIYEFFKENQVDFENELVLNMGQLLSIPLIMAGFIILANSLRKQPAVSKKEKQAITTSGS